MSRLVGREGELAICSRAITEALGGRGGVVLIEGGAGIGKTALLSAVSCHGAKAGLRVLAARGDELAASHAFGVARQLFEPLLTSASTRERQRLLRGAASLAELAMGRPDQAVRDPFAAVHGLYWLTANAAQRVPLMLCVDDAHWADPPTLKWLSYLARRADELRLLIAITIRLGEPEAHRWDLQEIHDLTWSGVIDLQGLAPEGTAELVGYGLPGACPDLGRRCHEMTAGHPLLLLALIREIQERGLSPDHGGLARLDELLPRSVSQHALSRLRRASPEAAEVARAVAVLMPHAHVRYVGGLTSLSGTGVARATDELRTGGVLSDERPLTFVHPLIRTAVYQSLGAAQRSQAHRRVAGLMEAEGEAAELIASHLLRTEPSGDAWAVRTLRAAAVQATGRGVLALAAEFLRRAIDEPPDPEERFELHMELGVAETSAQLPGCLETVHRVLSIARTPVERARAGLAFYPVLLFSGDASGALENLTSARAGLGRSHPELALTLDAHSIGLAPPALRAEVGDEIIARLGPPPRGDTPGERALLAQLAWRKVQLGATRVETVELALRALAKPTPVQGSDPVSLTMPGIALTFADATEEARRLFGGLLRQARDTGGLLLFGWVSALSAYVALLDGQLDEAETSAHDALRSMSDGGFPYCIPLAVHALAVALLERGRPDEAESLLNTNPLPPWMVGHPISSFAFIAQGRLELVRRRHEAALEAFRSAGLIMAEIGCLNPAPIAWQSGAALALSGLGRAAEARTLAERELAQARVVGAPRPLGVALRTLALIEPRDEAIGLLQEAVRTLESSTARVELARTLVELGAALRRSNKRSEARCVLSRGLDLAERCGATLVVQQALDELATAGARPRRRLVTGPEALTASESRVARMAAGGSSNTAIAQALFVTLKTVEKHLGNAYAKLEISSRGQLAGALGTSDAHGPPVDRLRGGEPAWADPDGYRW